MTDVIKGYWGQRHGVVCKVTTCDAGWSPVRPGWSPGCSTSNQAPYSCASEDTRGWPRAWSPTTHVGNLNEDPGSWLHFSSAPSIVASLGVNHWAKICLAVSPLCRI